MIPERQDEVAASVGKEILKIKTFRQISKRKPQISKRNRQILQAYITMRIKCFLL